MWSHVDKSVTGYERVCRGGKLENKIRSTYVWVSSRENSKDSHYDRACHRQGVNRQNLVVTDFLSESLPESEEIRNIPVIINRSYDAELRQRQTGVNK